MIEIITTGGTIDKTYNSLNGELEFGKSYVGEIIQNANLTIEVKINHLLQKDSLEMLGVDRNLILESVKNSKSDKIIITHGTDTMDKTAQTLTKIKDKIVILTGAMVPYSIQKSDSIFNIGFAIASVSTLKNGIYIAMNGRIFNAENVKKNTKIGVFENK
jgi:L-asparaginase